MEDEEWRRLQAKFGPAQTADIPTAKADQIQVGEPMEDEEFAALEAKFGPTAAAPTPEAPPEEATTLENIRHVVGGIPQAAADTADMPYYISQGIDAVAGWLPDSVRRGFRDVSPVTAGAIDMFQMAANKEGQISEKPGLKQAKELLAAEQPGAAPWAEYGRTGLEWGAGAIPKLVRGGIKNIPKNLPENIEAATPDIVMGTTAATGEVAGEYLSEGGGDVGELVGGFSGLILALRSGKTAGISKDQRVIMDALNEMYDNPEDAIAELRRRVEAGEIGSIGDLTREEGIFDVENWTQKATKQGRRQGRGTLKARMSQIYEDVTAPLRTDAASDVAPYRAKQQIDQELGEAIERTGEVKQKIQDTADTEIAVLETERVGLNQASRQAEEAAKTTQGQYDAARTEADPGRTTVEISESLDSRLNRAEAAHETRKVRPAWAEFDAGPRVDTIPMRTDMETFLLSDTFTPASRKAFLAAYPELQDIVGKWGKTTDPRDITDVIQDFKTIINEAAAGGKSSRHTVRLGELVDIMESGLSKTSDEYAAAVAATKEKHDRFGGRVGDATSTAEPETTAATLGTQGDRGAATVRQVGEAQVPTADRDLFDYVLAEATKKGENITPEFLATYQGAIDRMPEVDRAKLETLIGAKGARDTALTQSVQAEQAAKVGGDRIPREQKGLAQASGREQATLDADLGRTETGLTGDTRGKFADKPNETVDSLLNSPDGAGELKILMDEMETLREVDSFKTLVKERMERVLFDLGTDPKTDTITSIASRGDAYRRFKDMQQNLVDGNVLTQADVKRMEEAIERTKTQDLRKASRAYDITQQADEHINLLASGGAAAILGPMPGAYSLMVGGAIRRSLNSVLRGKLMAGRLDTLSDYLNNPEKYLADLDKLKTPEAIEREFLTRLIGAAQTAELIGGE